MNIEKIPISTLVFDPSNARLHDQKNLDAIKGSLTKFGQRTPIVVDEKNIILKGNGTAAAAKELGWSEIHVIRYSDLTETQKTAYAIADNRTGELAFWNDAALTKSLLSLQSDDFDIGAIGFDDEDLQKLFKDFGSENQDDDDEQSDSDDSDDIDDIEKIHAEPRVKFGDIWKLGSHTLVCGDSGNRPLVHQVIEEQAAHAIVTDPPYGLEFMGKNWDKGVPSQELWETWITRIAPGAHLLSFSGTRTYHRMTLAIEDAGFEVRDMMQWIYGQGFPKSQDISKAIDKAAGAEREVIYSFTRKDLHAEWSVNGGNQITHHNLGKDQVEVQITAPTTPEAKQWSGWGTALKPANEPICLARKPLSESTVAKNVLKHGTGGLNIEGARIETTDNLKRGTYSNTNRENPFFKKLDAGVGEFQQPTGRFPSNVILDEDAAKVLDGQTGELKPCGNTLGKPRSKKDGESMFGIGTDGYAGKMVYKDIGGASRFFYVAKASKSDRGEENDHATVKPISLMKYLVRLVTPEGGTVLEPFCGSGTTLLACEVEGFKCIAFELDPHHCDIILQRWENLTGRKAEKVQN